jgi:hypothetical protein
MMSPHCPTGSVAPLLLTLALGYGVLYLAKREARLLRRLGNVIGWLMILVSFAGLICIAASRLCRKCPTSGSKAAVMCPYGGPKVDIMPPESGERVPERG